MKATGIVRRIDDLGRVVIPKEIRRTMRIREGDPLEIYTDNDGEVIFKKYSPLGEISQFATQYAEVLHKSSGLPAVICDKDNVVSVAGAPKKEIMERRNSPALEHLLKNRRSYVYAPGSERLMPIENIDKYAVVCNPVIVSGDVVGAVMLLSNGENEVSKSVTKLSELTAEFLAKHIEA